MSPTLTTLPLIDGDPGSTLGGPASGPSAGSATPGKGGADGSASAPTGTKPTTAPGAASSLPGPASPPGSASPPTTTMPTTSVFVEPDEPPVVPPSPQTWSETTGGEAHTWTNYRNAGGEEGPVIPGGTTVQISCKLEGFPVEDGNTWWYRIASSPWSNKFYVSADAFYNNGATSGPLGGTPYVDSDVANC